MLVGTIWHGWRDASPASLARSDLPNVPHNNKEDNCINK